MYQSGAPTWWHSGLNYQCLNISISTGTFCYIKKNPTLLWERGCLYSMSVELYLFSASIRTVQKWNCWYIFKMTYIQASGTLYTALRKQSFKTYARQPTLIKNFFCNKVVNSAEKLFPASLRCIPPNIVLHLSPVNAKCTPQTNYSFQVFPWHTSKRFPKSRQSGLLSEQFWLQITILQIKILNYYTK
jgi:hypothetical protein